MSNETTFSMNNKKLKIYKNKYYKDIKKFLANIIKENLKIINVVIK